MTGSPNHFEHHDEIYDRNWYVLVTDLIGYMAPASPLKLAEGVTLSPIAGRISKFDLASAGTVGFHSWDRLQTSQSTCEIEALCGYSRKNRYDTLNRAWLALALLALRGFIGNYGIATSSYSWSEIAGCNEGGKRLRPFVGGMVGRNTRPC